MNAHLLPAKDQALLDRRNPLFFFHALLDAGDLFQSYGRVSMYVESKSLSGALRQVGQACGDLGTEALRTLYSGSMSSSISLPVRVRTLLIDGLVSSHDMDQISSREL